MGNDGGRQAVLGGEARSTDEAVAQSFLQGPGLGLSRAVMRCHVANRGCSTADEDALSMTEGIGCGCGFSGGRPKLWYSNPSSVMAARSRRLRPSTISGRLITA